MPGEDGLPTYEEVMGLERVLPQKIVQKINETRSSETSVAGKCCFVCTGLFLFLIFPLIGICMIIVGSINLQDCVESMLPTWLLVGGISIILFYSLFMLPCIGCVMFCFGQCSASCGIQTLSTSLMALDFLFGVIWFGLGCYWSWTSKIEAFSVSDKKDELLTSLETGSGVLDEPKAYECSMSVYWLSLGLTVSPFLLALLVAPSLCAVKRIEKTSKVENL